MRHGIVAAVLAVLVVLTGVVGGVVNAGAESITPSVHVAVASGCVDDAEEYSIQLVSARTLSRGTALTITFDDQVLQYGSRGLLPESVTVDGKPLLVAPTWASHTLGLRLPEDLAAGSTHEIRVLQALLLRNPSTPCHLRVTVRFGDGSEILVSNYYSITDTTSLVAGNVSANWVTSSHLMLQLSFSTGRKGWLLLAGQKSPTGGVASQDSTITLRLSSVLAQAWDSCEAPVVKLTILPPSGLESRLWLKSAVDRDTDGIVSSKKDLVFAVRTFVPASTLVSVSLDLDGVQGDYSLGGETVSVFTSADPGMITMSLDGSGTGTGTGGSGAIVPSDTTAPTITWTSAANTLLPRLVTLHITVTEDNLDEAWFSGGTGSFIHTRLSTGDNEVMVINRSGIHGTVAATDKSGNTTTIPVDLPALSGS